MAALTVTAADVRALQGAITMKCLAAEAMTVGVAVYVYGESGTLPTVKKTVATAVSTSNALGVVVAGAPEKNGSTTIASGDVVDVVTLGPVSGIAGTAGAFAWCGDTAGEIVDAVGTKSAPLGHNLTANTLMVRPFQGTRSA